jgi:hypothetical protein
MFKPAAFDMKKPKLPLAVNSYRLQFAWVNFRNACRDVERCFEALNSRWSLTE